MTQNADSVRRTSPAVRSWDATLIDGLKVHLIVDGKAICNRSLVAIFAGRNGDPTCEACVKRAQIDGSWSCDECGHTIHGPDGQSVDHAESCSLHPNNEVVA